MSEPELSELGARVREGDPDRFEAALFAEPDARERLFALYAFNLEIAGLAWRASVRSPEPQIGAMRLRWWLDVIGEAYDGAPPRAHEIAAPLNALIQACAPDRSTLERLVEARLRDLDPTPMESEAAFWEYVSGASGALTTLAAQIATPREKRSDALDAVAEHLGVATGVARILEATPELAAHDRMLLPAGPDERRAALKGETTPPMRAQLRSVARYGLERLAQAELRRAEIPAEATPALLSAWRARRVLETAMDPAVDLFRDFGPESPFRRRVSLLWRGLRGRW